MSRESIAKRILDAQGSSDYQFERVVVDLTETICEIMAEKGITRTELATRMGKSKPWVTKVLRGDQNMTLKTVVSILWELGYRTEIMVEERKIETCTPIADIPLRTGTDGGAG